MAEPRVTVVDFLEVLDRLYGEEDRPISGEDQRSMLIAEGDGGIGLDGWLRQRPGLAATVATLFVDDRVRVGLGDKHLPLARLLGVDRSEAFRAARRRWESSAGTPVSFWDWLDRFPGSYLLDPSVVHELKTTNSELWNADIFRTKPWVRYLVVALLAEYAAETKKGNVTVETGPEFHAILEATLNRSLADLLLDCHVLPMRRSHLTLPSPNYEPLLSTVDESFFEPEDAELLRREGFTGLVRQDPTIRARFVSVLLTPDVFYSLRSNSKENLAAIFEEVFKSDPADHYATGFYHLLAEVWGMDDRGVPLPGAPDERRFERESGAGPVRPEPSSGRPAAREDSFPQKLFAFYEWVHQSFEERLANRGRFERVSARRASMGSLVSRWEDFRYELLALMLDPEIQAQWGAEADPVIARFLRDFVSPQTRWLIRHLAESDSRGIPPPNPFHFFSAASSFPGSGLRILGSEVGRIQRGDSLGMIGISWRGCRTKYVALLLHPAVASALTENEVIKLWWEIELVYGDDEARRALKRVAALIDDAEALPAVKFKDPPPVRPVPEGRPRALVAPDVRPLRPRDTVSVGDALRAVSGEPAPSIDPKLFWQLIAVVRQHFVKRFPVGWDVPRSADQVPGLLRRIDGTWPDERRSDTLYGYLALLLDPQVQEKLGANADPLIQSYLRFYVDEKGQEAIQAYAAELAGPISGDRWNFRFFMDAAEEFTGTFRVVTRWQHVESEEIRRFQSGKRLADVCRRHSDLRTKYLALLLCPEVRSALDRHERGLAASYLREVLGTFADDSGLRAFRRVAALSPNAVAAAAADDTSLPADSAHGAEASAVPERAAPALDRASPATNGPVPAVPPTPPPPPLPEPDLEPLWRLVNDPSYGRISYNRFPLVRQDILLLQRQKGDLRRVLSGKPAIARALVGYLCWEDLSWRLSDPFKTIAPWLLSLVDWKSFAELEPTEESTGENIYQRFFAPFSYGLGDVLFTPLEVIKLQTGGLAATAKGNPAVIAKLVGALLHPRAKESGVAPLVLADIFRVAPQIRTGRAKINDLLNPPTEAATADATGESAVQPDGPRNRPASYRPEGHRSWRDWARTNGREWRTFQTVPTVVGNVALSVIPATPARRSVSEGGSEDLGRGSITSELEQGGRKKIESGPDTGFPPQEVPRGGNDRLAESDVRTRLVAIAQSRGFPEAARFLAGLDDRQTASLIRVSSRWQEVLRRRNLGDLAGSLDPRSATDRFLIAAAALAESRASLERMSRRIPNALSGNQPAFAPAVVTSLPLRPSLAVLR